MALNIADLAEHAIDAVPDRVALICGDDQLTYAQLEEKANRLAHYLIDQGVKKDDKVGLYCRNSIEIVIAMLGIVKAGAILVNVNYRYVEGELKYLFDNSDMVALVHERRYADRVANVLPETPNVKTVLVVEDGTATPTTSERYGGVEFYSAIAQGSPERDFGERSADDIYMLYTGGTTGFPKGVMWRHEDIYRVLVGGTDFATGEFVKDEYDLAKAAAENPPMIRYPIPPMIHGATQSATWMSLFSGQTTVLAPEFDADEVWRTIDEHKVNLLFFTGDAMARPLLDALTRLHRTRATSYDLSSLFLLASTAALFSPSIKEKFLELLPNRVITDSIGSSETGFGGTSIVAKGEHAHRRPARDDRPPHRRARRGRQRGRARLRRARRHREEGQHPGRLLQGREEDRRDLHDHQRRALRDPRRLRRGRGRRQRHAARPRLGVDQHRRREDLPRRGGGGAQGPPRRVRRAGGRRARRALRPARRRGGAAARRRPSDAGRARQRSCVSEIAGYKVPRSLW